MPHTLRPLRPIDAAALALFARQAGPPYAFNLAHAVSRNQPDFSLIKHIGLAFTPGMIRNCWVSGAPTRLSTVIRAGALRGPTVWEISEFYTSRRDDEYEVEILQEISSKAAQTGARRINLRVPADSDLLENALRAGFKRRHGESVYRSTSIPAGGATEKEIAARVGLRERIRSDDAGLFRLYSAVTPVEVRMQGGMTIDEWDDGQEARLRPKSEWVMEDDGRLNGSLGISPFGSERLITLMTMTDSADALPGMIVCATTEMNTGDAVVMVPEYDVTIRAALEIAGFEREREFDVLTHELAARVRKPVGVVTALN